MRSATEMPRAAARFADNGVPFGPGMRRATREAGGRCGMDNPPLRPRRVPSAIGSARDGSRDRLSQRVPRRRVAATGRAMAMAPKADSSCYDTTARRTDMVVCCERFGCQNQRDSRGALRRAERASPVCDPLTNHRNWRPHHAAVLRRKTRPPQRKAERRGL